MDELQKKLIDYFEGYELAELLQIPIEDMVELLAEQINSQREFLEDYLLYGR